LPIANCQLPIANCQLPIANCQLPIAMPIAKIANCQLPIADQLPASISDSRVIWFGRTCVVRLLARRIAVRMFYRFLEGNVLAVS
jgi:hypothetical protein